MVGAGTQGSAGRPYTPPTLSDSGSQAALPHLMPSGLRRLRHFAAKALEKNQVAAADDVIAVGAPSLHSYCFYFDTGK
jgi:hypothetical protein